MRLWLFISVCLITFYFPLPIAVCAVFLYTFRYRGIEAIILGVCIDALFGVTSAEARYWYTALFTCAAITAELLKPYMLTNFKDDAQIL